jgi:hypothetical protein
MNPDIDRLANVVPVASSVCGCVDRTWTRSPAPLISQLG